MCARNWLVKFAVSLYVIFFVIALWSILPSSVTGNVGWTSSLVEAQIASCSVQEGTESSQSAAAPQEREKMDVLFGETYIGWIFPSNETAYQCALQTGALFN